MIDIGVISYYIHLIAAFTAAAIAVVLWFFPSQIFTKLQSRRLFAATFICIFLIQLLCFYNYFPDPYGGLSKEEIVYILPLLSLFFSLYYIYFQSLTGPISLGHVWLNLLTTILILLLCVSSLPFQYPSLILAIQMLTSYKVFHDYFRTLGILRKKGLLKINSEWSNYTRFTLKILPWLTLPLLVQLIFYHINFIQNTVILLVLSSTLFLLTIVLLFYPYLLFGLGRIPRNSHFKKQGFTPPK
ncbi:hypothetical protein [Echinicola pacifica]|uniref:hypothetical protein n=1 Tax=Echinicola pacifica TaxID=346377 RepID=UPI0003727C29|nr:hypothetical protein [Echinicola pacifica]